MSFDFALVFQSLPPILEGMELTLRLHLLSLLLGTALAIFLALLRVSSKALLAWPALLYIYVFRGTPLLVQVALVYYGLAQFEAVRESFLWPILREPFWCAKIGRAHV